MTLSEQSEDTCINYILLSYYLSQNFNFCFECGLDFILFT